MSESKAWPPWPFSIVFLVFCRQVSAAVKDDTATYTLSQRKMPPPFQTASDPQGTAPKSTVYWIPVHVWVADNEGNEVCWSLVASMEWV